MTPLMDWDADAIARLRVLWDEGHPTAEIGRRMGISKNAVVGKARRLGLEPRPSPIKSLGAEHLDSRGRRPRGVVVTAKASVANPAVPRERVPQEVRKPAPEEVRATLATVQVPARPPRAGPVRACQWPIGDPRAQDFRFCGEPTLAGRPYCKKCCRSAYAKAGADAA